MTKKETAWRDRESAQHDALSDDGGGGIILYNVYIIYTQHTDKHNMYLIYSGQISVQAGKRTCETWEQFFLTESVGSLNFFDRRAPT